MRTHLALSLVMLSGLILHCQTPGDSPSDRRAAAERYARVADLKRVMDSMVTEMAKTVPPDRRDAFTGYMAKAFDMSMFKGQVIDVMVKHFTTKELNALAAFYGSPEGMSILKKIGSYMADMLPVVHQAVVKAAADFKSSQK